MDDKLKQNFQKLLDYQKKDIELRKINDVLARDDARVAMAKNKKQFDDAKIAMAECERQATAVINAINELQKYVDDNEKLLTEMEGMDIDAVEDFNEYIKKLESLKSKFASADKRIHELEAKGKAAIDDRKSALMTGKAAQQKYGEAKEKHNSLYKSKADEIKKLSSELEEMQKSLDPKLFEEYRRLVSENKFPPVVPARIMEKGGFNCGGCGLGLPQKDNALLKDSGWCRCENCRRIVVHLK